MRWSSLCSVSRLFIYLYFFKHRRKASSRLLFRTRKEPFTWKCSCKIKMRWKESEAVVTCLSSKSSTSCYFHSVHSAPFIFCRLHYLYCHIYDTKHYLPSNLCFSPIISVTQILVSPLDTVPHLHVCCLKSTNSVLSVFPLSYPSLSHSLVAGPHLSCRLLGVYSPRHIL